MGCDWYLWGTERSQFPIQRLNAGNQCWAVVCNDSGAFGGWTQSKKTTLLELRYLPVLSTLANINTRLHTDTLTRTVEFWDEGLLK